MLNTLIQAINQSESSPEKLIVYLNSEGGGTVIGEVIQDLINQNAGNIHLIACGDICSAAFEIFFKAKCERSILPGTEGMCHKTTIQIEHNYDHAPKKNQKRLLDWMKSHRKPVQESLCKELGFTDKEFKLFRAGEDVEFTHQRLRELFDYQNALHSKENQVTEDTKVNEDNENVQSLSS
jgi:hypothetical protein